MFFFVESTELNGRVSLDQGNCANRLDRVAHSLSNIFLVISVLFVLTYKLETKSNGTEQTHLRKKLNYYVFVFSYKIRFSK